MGGWFRSIAVELAGSVGAQGLQRATARTARFWPVSMWRPPAMSTRRPEVVRRIGLAAFWGPVEKPLVSRCCGCSRDNPLGLSCPPWLSFCRMVRIRTGTEACPYGAAPPRSVRLPPYLLKGNPPYPPLSGGQEKSKPPQPGESASPFFTPLTRGGRGGCFQRGRSGVRAKAAFPLRAMSPDEDCFNNPRPRRVLFSSPLRRFRRVWPGSRPGCFACPAP